ncbi:MAG: hypothetical protein ACD_19C00378G0002 [uncultured bacterium]|nr:MAG: hypothetical protein ACD_19C00378G0002 [uncultured bacterium]
MKVILASSSPRRIEMMEWLNIPFVYISPELDESQIRDNNPVHLTKKLSEAKAQAVADNAKNSLIIGSDAVVSFKNKIIEKPRDVEDQRRMLYLQRGKPAVVVTSVCVINTKTGKKVTRTKKTKYKMAYVNDEEIEEYIKKGVGLSRAGGYGQQDENGMFIGSEFDCYPNSIGFPICLVKEILEDMGIKVGLDIKKIVKQKTGKSC